MDNLGERRVLGEEAVAGMDRVGAGDLGGADDRGDVKVAPGGGRGPDADRLVGEAHVQRARVGLGVHGDGRDAELAARADDAQRDLAAVRDEDLLERLLERAGERPRPDAHGAARRTGRGDRAHAFLMRKSFCPNSTDLPF